MNKFNVGDKVVCIEGFQSGFKDRIDYGGAGYYDPISWYKLVNKDISLTIKGFIEDKGTYAYFFNNWENGIYEYALKSISDLRDEKLSKLL